MDGRTGKCRLVGYTISSPLEPSGSGELKIHLNHALSTTISSFNLLRSLDEHVKSFISLGSLNEKSSGARQSVNHTDPQLAPRQFISNLCRFFCHYVVVDCI